MSSHDRREAEPPGASGPSSALTIVHHHPGRLRVRALAFQAGEVAERALAALEGLVGVNGARHTRNTGSILVEYEPEMVDADGILETISAASGLDLPDEDTRARRREPAVIAIDVTRGLNDVVHELTGFRTDLRTLVPMGMTALAAYSFLRHPDVRLPRWDNLLYWSYNIFSQLHRREIDEAASAASAAAIEAPGGERGARES